MGPSPATSKADTGVRAARELRVREALDVLDIVARAMGRQLSGRFDLDDLRGHGHEAVLEVVERFDPDKGVPFKSYARLRLRGAIIDGIRKDANVPRSIAPKLRAMEAADGYCAAIAEDLAVPATSAVEADARLTSFLRGVVTARVAGLVGASEDDRSSDTLRDEPATPEAVLVRDETRRRLLSAVEDLGEPDATLLKRHYFHDDDLQDAAAVAGLSKSWGSRVHARALERLAARMHEVEWRS